MLWVGWWHTSVTHLRLLSVWDSGKVRKKETRRLFYTLQRFCITALKLVHNSLILHIHTRHLSSNFLWILIGGGGGISIPIGQMSSFNKNIGSKNTYPKILLELIGLERLSRAYMDKKKSSTLYVRKKSHHAFVQICIFSFRYLCIPCVSVETGP